MSVKLNGQAPKEDFMVKEEEPQKRKMFADPKMNKILGAFGAIVAVILIAGFVYVEFFAGK